MVAMSADSIEFWFEFASTYSYPAAMRVESVAQQYGRTVRWKPFLLGPIFQAQGWGDSPFNIYPIQGRYMWRDLERICAELDLPLIRPSTFPRNGLLAARVACVGHDAVWLPAFVRQVFTANFVHDRDISQPDVVLDCLNALVPDPQRILDAANRADAKAQLRANTEQAIHSGLFGAPSFLVEQELFWGNDRMEQAMRWRGRPTGTDSAG